MKNAGNNLTLQQRDINTLRTLLQTECPGVDAKAEDSTVDDQTKPALYKKAQNAEAACTEYTCAFVALQIWASDTVRKDGPIGEALRTSLAKALVTRATCGRQELFKQPLE